jgi:hypothetical protein
LYGANTDADASFGLAPEQAALLRLLEHDDFGVAFGDTKTLEGGIAGFGNGLPGCLDPLHA